jgi:alpha-D-ribose 1-methylphosphonate 5-phosphate C-P lyase
MADQTCAHCGSQRLAVEGLVVNGEHVRQFRCIDCREVTEIEPVAPAT